ncbi:MAG: hypothetical protein Q7S28_04455 [bacterium]|nr:hypothetical protein [bacterium]
MRREGFFYIPILFVVAALIAGAIGYGAVNFVKTKNAEPPTVALSPAPPQEAVTPPPAEFFNQELRQNIPPATTSSAQKTPPPPLKKLEEICAGRVNDWSCYEAHYAALVDTKGVKAAFVDIRARYDHNSYVKSQCHPLTHVIGRAASKKYPDTAAAYNEGDSFCWSGYYHGVLEGIIGVIGLKNLPAQLDAICANLPDKKEYGFNYYNCVHGLGHGLMAITQDELFESFAYCDKLTGYWEQMSCASGAYMENIIQDGKNHKTKFLRPEEPLYPCTESPEKYKNTCYLMQTSYMLKVNGRNFAQTFAWCVEAGTYSNTCYESLGRDASGGSISDVAKTRDICLLGPDNDARTHCVIGAVKDFISYYHSDVEANALCNSFSDTMLKDTCLATAADYYKSF